MGRKWITRPTRDAPPSPRWTADRSRISYLPSALADSPKPLRLLMAGRDRPPSAALEHHSLQNEGFGKRLLRRTLADSEGSGAGHHAYPLRIPIVRDRSVQFDVITSSDSY